MWFAATAFCAAAGVVISVYTAVQTPGRFPYEWQRALNTFAFFTIQGPAALASGRLERLARRGGIAGKITAHGATILFVAVTSVLFFDGVSKIFPFIYASQSPLP